MALLQDATKFPALVKQAIHLTSKENPFGIQAFWGSTLAPSSPASTDSIAPLTGASPTSWVPPGSSGHDLEGSAWCLCDPVLSLWHSQHFPFFLCVFHSSHFLGGPYAFANRRTKDPRPRLCILASTLCFWASASTAGVSRAGLRALCFSWVSLSTPTAAESASLGNPIQYHPVVRW